LSFIMRHLINVWTFQFKIRGCHYLPDKLFHIFRSILIRPPWEKICQIVDNLDKQSLVIQRLLRVAIAFVNTIQWRNCSLKVTKGHLRRNIISNAGRVKSFVDDSSKERVIIRALLP
jgi:hypothetical protein